MVKTKAIVFDKDGTLLDFDAFWLTITYKAIDDILKKVNRESIPRRKYCGLWGSKMAGQT